MISYYFYIKDIFPDKATERKILSFAIKCSSDGCDWTGELRENEVSSVRSVSLVGRVVLHCIAIVVVMG